MSRFRIVNPGVLLLVALSSGCVSSRPAQPTVGVWTADITGVDPGAVVGSGGGPSVVGRAFLHTDRLPVYGYRAYGYFVFTRRPSAEQIPEYVQLCAQFLRHLEPSAAYAKLPADRIVTTYWPVRQARSDPESCSAMVQAYDYPLGKELAQAAGMPEVAGPLLVAWPQPYRSGRATSIPLAVDLSGARGASADSVFGIWQRDVVLDPSTWEGRMDRSGIAREIVLALNRFGATITGLLPKPRFGK